MHRNNTHIELFDRIAPWYGLFYRLQKFRYARVLKRMRKIMDPSRIRTVIDVGCGTGALCSVLQEAGFHVTGTDPSLPMLRIAMKRKENRGITCVQANVLTGLPFDDDSFDAAIASFVAHGLEAEERIVMYREMIRVACKLVVIYDYHGSRSLCTDVIETLEGGGYFSFIAQGEEEMKRVCNVTALPVSRQTSWYVCTLEEIP